MDLKPGQWDLGGLIFGNGTNYPTQPPSVSYANKRTADADQSMGAGIVFGEDFAGANSITLEIGVMGETVEDAEEMIDALDREWNGSGVEKTPGAVIPLRYCRRRGQTRRVYGRPRRFAPIDSPTWAKERTCLAEFQCKDDKFYSDIEFGRRVTMVATSGGGLVAPLVAPIISAMGSSGAGEFYVGGVGESWTKLRIDGPIASGSNGTVEVELKGEWIQRMPTLALNHDESLEISSFPWEIGVYRNGMRAGKVFDQASKKLSALTIPPGQNELVLRGTDQTGTAEVYISGRETYFRL